MSGNISIEDQLEWEDYKGDIPFWKHAIAGSCAGVAEHVSMFPLDTAKTRLQAWSGTTNLAADRTFYGALSSVYQERGFFGLFRGAAAITSGCVPAHAALFGVYELMKSAFDIENDIEHHPIKAGICGATATLTHDMILTPLDVAKQRLQLGCYKNSLDCLQTIIRNEGAAALFRSMPTTVAMNLPFGAIMAAVNESLKRMVGLTGGGSPPNNDINSINNSTKIIKNSSTFPNSVPLTACEAPTQSDASIQYTDTATTTKPVSNSGKFTQLPLYFLCAGIAGAVAAAATTPFDVIKTRLQTQDCLEFKETTCCNNTTSCTTAATAATSTTNGATTRAKTAFPKYNSFLQTVRTILIEEGVRGMTRGMGVRMMLAGPSTAICWGTYESIKFFLGEKSTPVFDSNTCSLSI